MFRPGKGTESLNDLGSLSVIKYVVAEMIHNDPNTPVINSVKKGLFRGIRCEEAKEKDKQSLFVLLEDADGVIYILNTEYYNVLSVERSDGVSKYITFFQAHEQDQNLGRDLLASTLVKLNSENKTIEADPNIVDVRKYEEIPALFKIKGKNTSEASSNFKHDKQEYSAAATHERFQQNRQSFANKPLEPKVLKRSGRKPNTKTLDKMRERIIQLLDGETEPYIPKLDEDEAVQVDKLSKTATTYGCNDEYAGCMYG